MKVILFGASGMAGGAKHRLETPDIKSLAAGV